MNRPIEMFFLHKTTHLPTGKMFFGVHRSSDLNFGTSEWQDPYVGSGEKIRALPARRSEFLVERMHAGSESECWERWNRIILVYDHPLCLNSPVGAKPGVPKTPEHRAAISNALSGPDSPMADNANPGAEALADLKEGDPAPILKWFNNGVKSKLIAVDSNGVPVKEQYREWTAGQLRHKKD